MKSVLMSGATCAAIVALFGITPAFAGTIAQEPAPTLVAVAAPRTTITILANRINGITVTGHNGGVITAKAAGHATKSTRVVATTPAVIDRLDPGTRYQVLLNNKRIGFANVVGQVGATQELTVETTDRENQVSLSWKHVVNKGEGIPVSFTAFATIGNSRVPVAKVITTDTHAVLTGLSKNERYVFTVAASNSASTGRSSIASMQQTLAQISGFFTEPVAAPIATTQLSAPDPAPALEQAPIQAPAPGPATKTIYVCPDSYIDAGSLCQKLLAYTFHDVTTTSPYTYHQQFVQTGTHITFSTDGSNGGTFYPKDAWNSTDGSAEGFYAVIPDGYSISVKDSPPTGFSDDGTRYSKTDKVKDITPAGYSDNGTSWLTTTAKIAKVVPA